MINFSCCEKGKKLLIYEQSEENNIINEITIKNFWEHVQTCETCLVSWSEFSKSLPPTMKIVLTNFMRGL